MRKISFLCLIIFAVGAPVFSQKKAATLDEVWTTLNTNFDKYPFVHQINVQQYDDNRPAKADITSLSYSKGDTFDGKPISGNIVYIVIIQSGYRYEMKFDFVSEKEKGAKLSTSVKNSIWKFLTALNPPAAEKAQAAEQ
jgi:hypothetical protein